MSEDVKETNNDRRLLLINGGDCSKRIITIKYLISLLIKADGFLSKYLKSENPNMTEKSDFLNNEIIDQTKLKESLILYNGKCHKIVMTKDVDDLYNGSRLLSKSMHECEESIDSLSYMLIFLQNKEMLEYLDSLCINQEKIYKYVIKLIGLRQKGDKGKMINTYC